MKFKYSAIGKDTAENRKWLEKLGYYIPKIASKRDLLFTTSTGNVASLSNKNKGFLERDDSFIDCRSNPQLFQAVTDISTTTDIGKHYINNHTGQCKRCDYNMATDENIDWNDWSEATPEELKNILK